MTVYSAHNERTYRILGVDFNATPLSKFEMSAKDSHGSFLCSYQDYFSARYGLSITDTAQPLITVHPLPGQETSVCKLIPELVQFVGLTQGMRANKMVWREVATIAKVDAPVAIKKAQEFL